MREKLNSNPAVQAAVLGVLGIGVAFLLITRVMSQGGATGPPAETTSPAPAPTESAAPTAAAPTAAEPATGTPPAGAGAGGAAPSAGGAIAADSFSAGKGLPKDVANAYKNGKVVVLLIVRGPASDDRSVRRTAERLRGSSDSALFVVRAVDIAKYSRITQGVNVNRTPALVVVEPKKLAEGPLPVATVSYGFRGASSVEQAIRDARYAGKQNLPYHP